MENKCIAIEVEDAEITKDWKLVKKDFTTNVNYLGNNEQDIPVYINKNLNKGEIREIMESDKKEWKTLNDGVYFGKVIEVPYTKKYDDGKERMFIKIGNIVNKETNELMTDPETIIVSYTLAGVSEKAIMIANEQINKLVTAYEIPAIEKLYQQDIMVRAFTNKQGYKNYELLKPRVEFEFTEDKLVDCKIVGAFKLPNKNGRCLKVKFMIDGDEYDTIVYYNLNNKTSRTEWEWLINQLGVSDFTLNKLEIINPMAKLQVKISSQTDRNGKPYVNKKVILNV